MGMSSRTTCWVLLLTGVCASGCTTVVYQPLKGLQRPVALEPRAGTFTGLSLDVTCLQGDSLERQDAERVCRHVRRLFADQGAVVRTSTKLGAGAFEKEARDPFATKLKLDLQARHHRLEAPGWGWFVSLYTATLVPAVSEETFVQDVRVRDEAGFLLGAETWQGRFVEYWGLGYSALNYALDHTVRAKDEMVTDDNAQKDFSRDFDRQLTQLLYNARVRAELMKQNDGPVATGGPVP